MKVRATLSLMLLVAAPALAAPSSDVRIRVQGDVTISEKETVASAVAILGSVVVNGAVSGDAVSVFGDVVIGPKGSVSGNAVSIGGKVRRSEGAVLAGKQVIVDSPTRDLGRALAIGLPVLAGLVALVGALVMIASTVGFLVLVVAILVLFERNVAAARRVMVEDPLRAFLVGFLLFIGTIPLSVFLAVTIIGVPLAILVLAVVMAAACLGTVAVCEWIGAEIARQMKRPLQSVWAGLLGLAVLFVAGLIPWLGTVVHVVAVLLGIGAVARTRFRALPETAVPPAE